MAVTLLVLASVGSAVAVANVVFVRARDAETRQRQRADANWRKAFETVDRVCLAMAEERLPRVARPTPADRALVTELLAFYEDFVRENGSDPAVPYEAARACLRVGDLCQRLDRPSEAARAYRQAVARARTLTDEFPDDPRYRRVLAAGLAQSAAIDIFGVIGERPTRYINAEAAAREAGPRTSAVCCLARRTFYGRRLPNSSAWSDTNSRTLIAGRPVTRSTLSAGRSYRPARCNSPIVTKCPVRCSGNPCFFSPRSQSSGGMSE